VRHAACGSQYKPWFRRHWTSARIFLLLAVGSVSTLFYLQDFTIATYLRVFFPLFGLYGLAVVIVFWKRPGSSSCLMLIVGFAVVFRLIVLFSPLVLSGDLYRYVWDGRVQRAGVNPYRYPPEAEALAALRDTAIYPQIIRPVLTTIYPPAAQMFFALITTIVPDSIRGMKAFMVLFDLITIGVLIRLLKTNGSDPERVVLYAWSPLVVFEFAGSGHVDALMLPCLLLALQARLAARPGSAGVLLGLATLLKLYPAVLFPALYSRRERRYPLGFGAALVLGYLPYVAGAGTRVFGYLPGYFGPWEDFNGGLRYFLTLALSPLTTSARSIALGLCAILLLLVALFVLRRDMTDGYIQRVSYMISAYLLLVPTTFHPWYIIWLLPCLCFSPSWGWLYLSGAIALSYLAYIQSYPIVPIGIHLLEFLPLYVLLLAQGVRQRWQSPLRVPTAAMLMQQPK
jgi:alpha-1,6-mannosyltransferase